MPVYILMPIFGVCDGVCDEKEVKSLAILEIWQNNHHNNADSYQ